MENGPQGEIGWRELYPDSLPGGLPQDSESYEKKAPEHRQGRPGTLGNRTVRSAGAPYSTGAVRNFSLRPRSHSRVSSRTTEKPMSRVAAAAMVGLWLSRISPNICRGRVACSGPARNSGTTTSAKGVAKANSAPEMTPGAIS